MKLYAFWTVPLSIISSFSLYTQQWYISYRFAVCTGKNSWTEELSETCRISFQEYIWEISASSWFYYKKFITMYGHMNIKQWNLCSFTDDHILEYDANYSSLLGGYIVFVSKLFRTFQRHCSSLKCPRLFIHQVSITSQKPWIFSSITVGTLSLTEITLFVD